LAEINSPMLVPIIVTVIMSALIIIGIGVGVKFYLDQVSVTQIMIFYLSRVKKFIFFFHWSRSEKLLQAQTNY
jgi:hypothetical protein